jgi:hypothetical protein
MTITERYSFFLGGHDLEMLEIKRLIADAAPNSLVYDKHLSWGAKASAYGEELSRPDWNKVTPVLIELEIDSPMPETAIIIDHHGPRAGGPSSIEQVQALLDPAKQHWNRWRELVAANDVGHIAAMRALNATANEMNQIRRADRAAQGITKEQEDVALEALAQRKETPDGTCFLVELPHAKTAPVMDALALAGDDHDVLIRSPDETNFFGSGIKVAFFDKSYPGGWSGGELPGRGFWGIGRRLSDQELIRP